MKPNRAFDDVTLRSWCLTSRHAAKKATSVEAAVLSPRGSVFEIQATYLDSRQETIELHEYTALSLLGYLQQYLDAANRLTGPVGGHA